MGIPRNDAYQLTYNVSALTNSLDFKFTLWTNSRNIALNWAAVILEAHARVLPLGYSISRYPRVSSMWAIGDGVPIEWGDTGYFSKNVGEELDLTNVPAVAAPEVDFTLEGMSNDPDVGYLVRTDADDGSHNYRTWRGLRDTEVADYTRQIAANFTSFTTPDYLWVADPTNGNLNSVYPPAQLTDPGPWLIEDAWGLLLSTVRDLTCIVHKTAPRPAVFGANWLDVTTFSAPTVGDPNFAFVRMAEKKAATRHFSARGRQRKFA